MTTGRKIPIARPDLGEAEALAARRAILSGWITQGPEVAAFEKEFADFVGAPFACAVSSCTTALHLALAASGVGPGDEVITASHSFIATANSVRYCGAVPVFVDIERDSFNMDPRRIEEVITERTKAILCVHQMGMPCDLAAILPLARARGLKVIEDAACAAGSEILWGGRWERIGRPHGDVACFSFHPRKVMSTGDGGMLTARDPELDRRFRLLRQHGMSVPDTVRHKADQVIFESYESLGFNYRMTDIQAAVGREQLRRLPGILARRRELAARYSAGLARVEEIAAPREAEWARSNWQSYCVRLAEGSDQRAIMQVLLERGISTRRGIMCAHREPAYRVEPWTCGKGPGACGCREGSCRRLAQSEAATDGSLLLPLYSLMTDEDQDAVIAAVGEALCHGKR